MEAVLSVIDIRFVMIALAFVCWDCVSGTVASIVTKTFKSSIMREGGVHKLGIVMVLAFVISLDIAQGFCDLGLSIPLTSMACVYVIAMEIGSSWENLKKIWPDLAKLKTLNKTVDELTNKAEE